MVGRSNVGKSSLINALVNRKIARTSAAPGKTRLANYYLIEDAYYLVDLPGYGYARGGRESVEEFEALTRQYFDPSSQPGRVLGGVLHLIDARHPELPQDVAAHEWLVRTGASITIVATKMDKLARSDQGKAIRTFEAMYDFPVVAESVTEGRGLDDLWTIIRAWTRRGSR